MLDESSRIIQAFFGQLPKEQLESYLDLVKHGEDAIALENLCTQIYEYSIPISQGIFEAIVNVCTHYNVDSDYFEDLRVLIG